MAPFRLTSALGRADFRIENKKHFLTSVYHFSLTNSEASLLATKQAFAVSNDWLVAVSIMISCRHPKSSDKNQEEERNYGPPSTIIMTPLTFRIYDSRYMTGHLQVLH